MKLKLYLLLFALCSMVTLQSCSDDDDPISVSDAIQNAFKAKFPSATNEKWEQKSGYYVAEFRENGKEIDAWFTANAEWSMTETDLGTNLTLLPDAVQTTFNNSEYKTWRVEDIDFYERPDKSFYLIEVETTGQKGRKLFYNPDGTLIKDVEDKENDDILPNTSI